MARSGPILYDVDHGDGAYGETIRITVPTTAGLDHLAKLFETAANTDAPLDLLGRGRSINSEITSLSLICNGSDTAFEPIRTARRGEWTWPGRPTEWLDCRDKILAMIDLNVPCHQYLTEPDAGLCIVEVSYRE